MQPKQYVAGSRADAADGGPTLVIGAVAAAIAVIVAIVGITGMQKNVAVGVPPSAVAVVSTAFVHASHTSSAPSLRARAALER
jgi:hypothetical protein